MTYTNDIMAYTNDIMAYTNDRMTYNNEQNDKKKAPTSAYRLTKSWRFAIVLEGVFGKDSGKALSFLCISGETTF